MSIKWRSRLCGLVMVLMGWGWACWTWHDATLGRIDGKKAMLGPALVAIGLHATLEGPEVTFLRPSALGRVFLIGGLVLGVLYAVFLKNGNVGPGR